MKNSILIVCPWLMNGGAQKALIGILKRLPKSEIKLLILFSGNTDLTEFDKYANNTLVLNHSRSVSGIVRAARDIRHQLKDFQTVYSLMRASHLVMGLIPKRSLKDKRLIGSLHQLPSSDRTTFIGKLEDLLVKRYLRQVDYITAPSKRALAEAVEYGYSEDKKCIYEPNIIDFISNKALDVRQGDLDVIKLVAAGRLTDQKGFDRIPELLKQVTLPVHIKILGDGPDRDKIHNISRDLSPENKVELVGHVDDVGPYIDWSDAIFMPSRAELNPVFVWEAFSRGRGVVASELPVFKDLRNEYNCV